MTEQSTEGYIHQQASTRDMEDFFLMEVYF